MDGEGDGGGSLRRPKKENDGVRKDYGEEAQLRGKG